MDIKKCEYCKYQKEVWKPIDGFIDYYISNKGRVKSVKNGKNKLISNCMNGNGYLYVGLCEKNKTKMERVHRLVATAFISKNNVNDLVVNHIDGNKQHNCVSNLEWCTSKYNTHHAIENGLFKNEIVFQLDSTNKIVDVYHSIREASRITGFDNSAIAKCTKHVKDRPRVGGYKWRLSSEMCGRLLIGGDS